MDTVDLSLDADAEKFRLFTFFRVRAQLVGCLRSTTDAFFPLYDENRKPNWYEALNNHLDSLKRTACTFLDDQAPDLTRLPQAFINFSNVVAAAVPAAATGIEDLIQATGDQRKVLADQVSQVIGQMVREAQTQSAGVTALDTELRGFRMALATEVAAFNSGAQSITAAMAEEQARVVALTNDIAALQAQIEKRYQELIKHQQLEQGALDGAAVGLPYAYGMNRWTTSVTLFIMTSVITIGDAISQDTQIVTAMKQILDKQSELSADAQDILALNLLAVGSQQMQEIEASGDLALARFAQTLSLLGDQLAVMQEKVASVQTTTDDLAAIKQSLTGFGSETDALSDYCQELQDAALAAVDVPLALITIGDQKAGAGG